MAGWDKHEGGSVYAIPMGGTLVKTPFTIGGSGSAYIYGLCDKLWRVSWRRCGCAAWPDQAAACNLWGSVARGRLWRAFPQLLEALTTSFAEVGCPACDITTTAHSVPRLAISGCGQPPIPPAPPPCTHSPT